MVGASVCARIAAFDANRVKACALPVEKVAVPITNLADGAPSLSSTIALEELSSSNLAAPARNCMLPCASVLILSPPYTVVPTSALVCPTCARSAAMTVPTGVILGVAAPHAGTENKPKLNAAAPITRRHCIKASRLELPKDTSTHALSSIGKHHS